MDAMSLVVRVLTVCGLFSPGLPFFVGCIESFFLNVPLGVGKILNWTKELSNPRDSLCEFFEPGKAKVLEQLKCARDSTKCSIAS